MICDAPKPRDVAMPIMVVRIAIISIVAARGLFSSTEVPNKELTLNAFFLCLNIQNKERHFLAILRLIISK